MTDEDRIPQQAIIDHYGGLARATREGALAMDHEVCSPASACFGADAYDDLAGLPEDAVRASLGCGNPVAVADLRPGETVLDLGSGGGIDVLLSARRVAPGGLAYGLDASPDMIALAEAAAEQAGVDNVRFLHGRIEDVPLPDAAVDAVISNCVLNLSSDKPRVLAEAFRVLRPGGRLGVSDIVADDAEPEGGDQALTAGAYRTTLAQAGFVDVTVTSTGATDSGRRAVIVHATKPTAGHGES